MNRISHALFVVALVAATGCGPMGDIIIRNPMVAGAVDQNNIVKQHAYAERLRGLPQGSMSDQAALTRLGNEDICFDVVMHELDPIDMHMVRAKLSVSGQVPREQAQLWPEQPVARDYPGLVPQRVQTGYETYCMTRAYNGVCLAWNTRPMYGTVMQPGTVSVYETRARMCFPNGGFVTAATESIRLDLTVPRPQKTYDSTYSGWGMWGAGMGDKRTAFRWGLEGLPKKK
jgi:hypothetical protein